MAEEIIHSVTFQALVGLLVLGGVLFLYGQGNASAGELGERFDNAFVKDKLILDVQTACMRFEGYDKLAIDNVVIQDYKEFADRETFIFTAEMRSEAAPDYQLSSTTTVAGERKEGQWEFPSEPMIEFSISGLTPGDVDDLRGQEYVYVTAWKSVGLDLGRRYDVTLEKFVVQKADFYAKTFRVGRLC